MSEGKKNNVDFIKQGRHDTLSLSTSVLLPKNIHVFVNMLQICVFISIAECDREL